MPTDRKDKRAKAFTDFEQGARSDEFIFGDRGYTEADMRGIDDNIAGLLTGTPPVDPPIDPPEPPIATWNISIPDNSTYFSIFLNQFTTKVGASYAITFDDVTESTTFTTGFPPSPFPVPDYLTPATAFTSTYTVRLWQTDDVDGPIEIFQVNTGASGISISPKDTNSPTVPSISIGTDGSYTLTPGVDTQSGISRHDLYEAEGDVLLLVDIDPTGAAGAIPLIAGVEKFFYVVAYDNGIPPNGSDPSEWEGATAPTSGQGTVRIDSQPDAVDEGVGSALVFSITGRGEAEDVSFTFQTLDIIDDCVDGTHYYGRGEIDASGGAMTREADGIYGLITRPNIGLATNVGDVIRIFSDGSDPTSYSGDVTVVADSPPTDNTIRFAWADTAGGDPGVGVDDDGANSQVDTGFVFFPSGDDTDVTIEINTEDQTSPTNNVFESFINLDSISGTATIDQLDIFRWATLHRLNGTGGSGTGNFAEYTEGTAQIIVLDTDMTEMSLEQGTDTSNSWVQALSSTTDGNDKAAFPTGDDCPTNVIKCTGSNSYTTEDNWLTVTPKASWVIDIETTGLWRLWVRGEYDVYPYRTIYASLNGVDLWDDYINFVPNDVDTPAWKAAYVDVNISQAGTYQLSIHPRQRSDTLYINGVIFANGSFTPNDHDEANSIATSDGPVIDNPDNPSTPIGGSTPDTVTSGFDLFPVNGATDVPLGINPTITFNDPVRTGVDVISVEATSGGSPIGISLISTGTNSATFDFTGVVVNASAYVITLTMRIVDTDGLPKNVTTGTWSFTTIAKVATGDVIMSQDHNDLPLGNMSDADIANAYDAGAVVNNRPVAIVDTGIPSRGRCMRIDAIGGSGNRAQMLFQTSFTPVDELYLYYDIRVDADHEWAQGKTGHGVNSGSTSGDGGVGRCYGGGGSPDNCFSMRQSFLAGDIWSEIRSRGVPNDNQIDTSITSRSGGPEGGSEKTGATRPANTTLDERFPSGKTLIGMQKDTWHGVKYYLKINTQFGGSANGICKLWLDGELVMDLDDVEWSPPGAGYQFANYRFQLFLGGSDEPRFQSKRQFWYYDNFIVSESDIGALV